jgi:lysyl-tRNA synthetase class 2
MSFTSGADLGSLRRRADILAAIRRFFAARGVLEVETPALSAAGVSDLNIESVTARARALGGPERMLYLHTSPEYAMKRLLAAGSGDIYQMCRVFRDDELGRWHEPEFTLLEWYRVGWTDKELMDEVAALFAEVLPRAAAPVFVRYSDAFRAALGCDALADPKATLAAGLAAAGVDVPAGLSRDALLDLGFAAAVAPRFDSRAVTFVHDFPPSQAALARLRPGSPPVAARFEAFYAGLELANGFAELNDAHEQRKRFEQELEARRTTGRPTAPLDEAFLAAVDELPDCAGVAVGVDRLVAAALGATALKDVLAFTHRSPP